MEQIKLLLYSLFANELYNLNIGYTFNKCNINRMIDLVHVIDYVYRVGPDVDEVIKIVQKYAQ